MFIRQLICFLSLSILSLPLAAPAANLPDSVAEEVRDKVAAHLLRQFHLPQDDVVFEFGDVRGLQKIGTPWDEIRVLPAKRKVTRGLQIVQCGLFAGRDLLQTVSVKVRARTFQDVVVLTELLGRHEIIRRNHLSLSRRETTRLRQMVFTEPEQVVGKRCKRILHAGDLVTENKVEDMPMVAAGSPVKIHFRGEGIEITMPGIARQDGFANSKILVKCLTTKKNFTAIVQSARSVVVDF